MISDIALIAAALFPTLAGFWAVLIGMSNSKKADAIHTLCNSRLETLRRELALSNTICEKLQADIIAMRSELNAARVKP
jgi:hypothetical protein